MNWFILILAGIAGIVSAFAWLFVGLMGFYSGGTAALTLLAELASIMLGAAAFQRAEYYI